MKNIIKNTILTAFLALTMISCKDDTTSTPVTPPVTSKDYYSMKIGAYWIYDNADYNDQSVSTGVIGQDSVAISATTENMFSKTAFKTENYSAKTGEAMTKGIEYHRAFNADQLFVTAGFLESFKDEIPFPINIDLTLPTDKWYLIADSKQSTWNVLDTPIELKDLTLESYPGFSADISYQIIMTRKATGTMIDPMDATKTLNTIEFEMKNSIGIKAKYLGLDIGLTKPSVDLITYLVFAEGVGLVKGYTPTQDIKLSTVKLPLVGVIDLLNQKFLGGEKILKKYKK